MRSVRWTRPAALLISAAALAATGLTGVGQAGAAPVPFTVEGTAVASGTFATFTYTIDVTDAPVTSATFTTDQDAALPADDGSLSGLRVDRARTTTATRSNNGTGPDLIVALSNLSVGRHTVVFPVELPASGAARTTHNSATVTDGTTPVDSNDVTVAINSPDLTMAYDDPEDAITTAYAGLGSFGADVYDIANAGTSPVQAQLRLRLPAGIELDKDGVTLDDDGVPGASIGCVSDGNDLVCPLGTIAPGAVPKVIDVSLIVTTAGAYNTHATYYAAVEPATGGNADANPANNVITYDVLFTGEADLTIGVSASAKTVVVGGRATVTLRFHNAGPNPALFATGIVIAGSYEDKTPAAKVTGFDGNQTPPADYPEAERARAQAMRAQSLRAAVTRHDGAAFTGSDPEVQPWFPGSLAAGQTGVAHLELQGVRPGSYSVSLIGLSAAGNPNCDADFLSDSLDPCFAAATAVTVVAAPPAHRPTGNGSVPLGNGTGTNGTGSGLANTGSPTLPLTVAALGLLAAGALLTRAGRRVHG